MALEKIISVNGLSWLICAAAVLVPFVVRKVGKRAEIKFFLLGLACAAVLMAVQTLTVIFFVIPPLAVILLSFKYFDSAEREYSAFYGAAYGVFLWLAVWSLMIVSDISAYLNGNICECSFEGRDIRGLAVRNAFAPFAAAAAMLLALFVFGKKRRFAAAGFVDCVVSGGVLIFIVL